MTLLRSHGKDDEMQNELLVDDEEGRYVLGRTGKSTVTCITSPLAE